MGVGVSFGPESPLEDKSGVSEEALPKGLAGVTRDRVESGMG